MSTLPHPKIAIFVALQEEREVFLRSNLSFDKGQHHAHLIAEKDGVMIEVFCAYSMGRVAAAVETMAYLRERGVPSLLLITGIAGGFKDAGVKPGTLLIPTDIIDLAIRKVRDDSTKFRPSSYRCDQRLMNYLESNLFDKNKWAEEAHNFAEWPSDMRPSIRYDLVTSVDEVVSSIEHVAQLRQSYDKLAGVEMEAGGVCAAAVRFKVDFAVIRGVSDQADPSKADDEWRRRSMKTVISLLQSMDLRKMLEYQR